MTPTEVGSAAPAASEPVVHSADVSTPASVSAEMDSLFASAAPPDADAGDLADEPEGRAIQPETVKPPQSPEAPPEEEAVAEEAAIEDAPQPTDLPEGVRTRKLNGKDVWVMDPTLAAPKFERAALADRAEEIFGEPLTEDSIAFRQGAVQNWEGIRSDILSDKPEEQRRLIEGFSALIGAAQANGEIGHDALGGIVRTTIDASLEDPRISANVLAHLESKPEVQAHFIDGLYRRALEQTDEATAAGMWNAAQWIDKTVNQRVRPTDEFGYLRKVGARTLPNYSGEKKQPAPTAPVEAKAATPNAEFDRWQSETNTSIGKEAVEPRIKTVVDSVIPEKIAKNYPTHAARLAKDLNDAVNQKLRGDKGLSDELKALSNRARLAVKPEIRQQLKDQAVSRYAMKVDSALREVKGPIIAEFSNIFKATSDQQQAKAAAGQRAGRQAAPANGPSVARQERPAGQPATFRNKAEFDKVYDAAFAK